MTPVTDHPGTSGLDTLPRVRRTSTTLADGRELIYFDDSEPYRSGAKRRDVADERPLGARTPSGTIRLDALTGDWVSIAGHRQNRTFLPPANECPLCPTGRGTVPSEIPAEDYDVVVFENRFPSFATEPTAVAPWVNPLFAQAPALGRCEVVCFTSDHDASFSSLSPARARTVVDAWADRTRALSALDVVQHVFVFENRGQEIGVTLHHPHGQIYAYPFLPARTAQVLRQATEHHERTGRLLGADLLAAELDAGSRVVIRGTHWTAYVPYAARWPVEVHLAPNRDVPDLVALDGDERDELAEVYLDLLGRLDRYYQGPSGSPIALPYIAGWHQAPVRQGRDVSRLHLQVMSVRPLDRLSDKQIRARAKHIVTEIERVRATVALLRSRRLPDVGPVFNASHASMRDDFEISCAELGLAVEVASAHDALGARMTGGGLGGSAITLVPTDSTAEVTSAVIQAFADKGFALLPCHRGRTGPGASPNA